MFKKIQVAATAVMMTGTMLAGHWDDRPANGEVWGWRSNTTHAYAVHDLYRPNPAKISAEPGCVPSDAKILFDGTQKSIDENWTDVNGKPTKWTVDDGDLISVKGAGYIRTKEVFGDCQLHVEWKAPTDEPTLGQDRGNSGVFLMDRYEVQVLDSYLTDPLHPEANPNYADGQAGAIYGQNPPMVNPARKAGAWQTYDIIFHAPKRGADGEVARPATITVLFNGVLVQDSWPIEGNTFYRKRSQYLPQEVRDHIKLQDHGHPVHYRNIWIREIPDPWAPSVHGGYNVDQAAVAAKRREMAEKTLAKLDAKAFLAHQMIIAFEAYGYCPIVSRERFAEVSAAYVKELKSCDAAALRARKSELHDLAKAVNMFVDMGRLCESDGLAKTILECNKMAEAAK